MNDIISQNKVSESIRNDVTSVLICFPRQNIQNGSTERTKKNSEGSSVNFEWLLSESDYFNRLFWNLLKYRRYIIGNCTGAIYFYIFYTTFLLRCCFYNKMVETSNLIFSKT